MKIFIIFGAFIALHANAKTETEVSLESTAYKSIPPTIDTGYGADSELERAWIVLTLNDKDKGESRMPTETIKVKVQGLSFDRKTGSIIYENNQEKTVCAVQKRFLASKYYKKLKNCQINVSLDTRNIDDGFILEKENIVNVILDSVSQ